MLLNLDLTAQNQLLGSILRNINTHVHKPRCVLSYHEMLILFSSRLFSTISLKARIWFRTRLILDFNRLLDTALNFLKTGNWHWILYIRKTPWIIVQFYVMWGFWVSTLLGKWSTGILQYWLAFPAEGGGGDADRSLIQRCNVCFVFSITLLLSFCCRISPPFIRSNTIGC